MLSYRTQYGPGLERILMPIRLNQGRDVACRHWPSQLWHAAAMLVLVAGPAMLASFAENLAQGAEQARRPNVVFVLADDLGWADLSCYGSRFHKTPHVDALARRGMRFTQAYAASPLCSPTRSSILTGLYPARIGITISGSATISSGKLTVTPDFVGDDPLKVSGSLTGWGTLQRAVQDTGTITVAPNSGALPAPPRNRPGTRITNRVNRATLRHFSLFTRHFSLRLYEIFNSPFA